MRSIPHVFLKDLKTGRVDETHPNPEASWVIAGEGDSTRLWNGEVLRSHDGALWRSCAKKPKGRPPKGFTPDGPPDDSDAQPGWVPLADDDPLRAHVRSALGGDRVPPNGLYQIVGPGILGNTERKSRPVLMVFGGFPAPLPDRSAETIRIFLEQTRMHGILFVHPDGRFAQMLPEDFKESEPADATAVTATS